MIHVGTSGFKFDDWKGSFYPAGLKEKDWLSYYARHFNALEINSSFYRLMHPATFYRMAEKVPEGFCFVVKLYRTLTHEIGPGSEADLATFLDSIRPLQDAGKLGCLIAQFPTSFRPGQEALDYLASLRERCGDVPLAVEFRHRSWAADEVFDFLRSHRLAYVCVDEPQFSNLMPPIAEATADFAYVRFHGRNYQTWWKSGEEKLRYDYLYSREELEEWLPKIEELHRRTDRVYVFMNNCFQGKAATNALELAEMLEESLGPALPRAGPSPPAQTTLAIEPPLGPRAPR